MFWKFTCACPKTIFQYLAFITSTLNVICTGMHNGWSSPSLPRLFHKESPIHITNDQGSWIAVMFTIGSGCGSIIAGITLDRIGRKRTALMTSISFFTSWMMVAFARSLEVLIVARFIAGISDGILFCSVPVYLSEIADFKVRGFFVAGVTVALMFGILMVNIIGSYFSISITALVCSAVPVITLLTFPWMPESPYYLIMKGNIDAARRSLIIFRGTNDVNSEINRLTEAVKEQNTNTGKFLDLFTVKSNRRGIYVSMGACAAQQCCGIGAITYYTQTIFKEAGSSFPESFTTIIYCSLQVAISGLCSVIVDKTGRRCLMIVSITGAGLALLTEGCYFYVKNTTDMDTYKFSPIAIIALVVYVISFNLGMHPIPLLLLSEFFPTNVKAAAGVFSTIYFSLIATVVTKFFQFTKDEFGMHVPFFAFTACSVLGLLFVILFIPETKHKTLEEIQKDLSAISESKS